MKQGMTLQALATEVERINETKRDLVVDTRHLVMTSSQPVYAAAGAIVHEPFAHSTLTVDGLDGGFEVLDYAHGQIAEYAKVPLPFYRRLRSSYPDALDYTVNRILHAEPARRMVRTIDGKARALLSDRYRRFDNYDLLGAVVPTLHEVLDGAPLGGTVESCDLTETRLYLTVVFPMWETEIRVGDPVRLGVRISNSEVGAGACKVETILFRLVCRNGMTTQHTLRRNHVGKRSEETEDYSVYSDATLALDDAAFYAKVSDSVRACASELRFQQIVSEMKELAETKIDADPIGAVEILANRASLTDDERKGVLSSLIDGGDRTSWGYLNAITTMAQTVDSYDRSMALEALAGRLAGEDLPKMLASA